jgi:hypothetical protein
MVLLEMVPILGVHQVPLVVPPLVLGQGQGQDQDQDQDQGQDQGQGVGLTVKKMVRV